MHGRFLTISERISAMRNPKLPAEKSGQILSYKKLGTGGFSSNVFVASEPPKGISSTGTGPSTLVGTDYILNVSLHLFYILSPFSLY